MKKSVRYILNSLSLPVFVVGPNSKISFLNNAAKNRYADADTGVAFSDVVTSKKCLKALKRVLKGAPAETATITMQDVVPTSYRVALSALDTEDGAPPSCVLSFEDISHIQEAKQMRHDFVANVSHELRSPLTAMSGFIETLQGPASNDTEARERFLEMMATETDRMARLVAELLSLSKFQATERYAPTSKTDLRDILERIQSSLSVIAQRRDIDLTFDLTLDVPKIAGDPDELTQVFQNLIENAIKYSPQGSEVKVYFKPRKPKKTHICVCVEDNGEGIDPQHIPRLTERFYRVDKGRSRAQGGTGLGLAIVKHILIRHRGWLKIKSEIGEGSTFEVYLPK